MDALKMNDFCQRKKDKERIEGAKDRLFNKWCWENWTDVCRKNETRPPSYTTHNKFKMGQRLKCYT